WRESMEGGATRDSHHPFIRLRDTGGAHPTRLKRYVHLQGCAAGACSTCHDGLLVPLARARHEATPCGAVPRETRPHSWGAVVSVECSSSTLPKSWQLCRKCNLARPCQHGPGWPGTDTPQEVPSLRCKSPERHEQTSQLGALCR